MIPEDRLLSSLAVLDIPREDRKAIMAIMDDYLLFNGHLIWNRNDLPKLQKLVQHVLGLSDKNIGAIEKAEELRNIVKARIRRLSAKNTEDICLILTSVE